MQASNGFPILQTLMAEFLDAVVATALPAVAGAMDSIGNATCRTLTPSCCYPWQCSYRRLMKLFALVALALSDPWAS